MSIAPRSLASVLSALAFLAVACGRGPASDPGDREIPWKPGPTTGTSSAEHMQATGAKGGAPLAKGWKLRLLDRKRLVVHPYELAASHPLFGKVVLSLGLYDQRDQKLATLRSEPVTAQNASFTFELADDVAAQLWDVVIWYVKA